MSPVSTLVLTITPRTSAPGDYWVQLAHEGKPLAEAPAHLDLQQLLVLEYSFDAPAYGKALYQALFTGNVGQTYQRLIGQAGSAASMRIQLVISDEAGELHALAWERLFHPLGDTEGPPIEIGVCHRKRVETR